MMTPRQNESPLPFFARKTAERPFVVKTGVLSGLTHHERAVKGNS